jgi:hypothetical protein
MQIQNCSHHGPRGSGEATIGNTIFTCAIYWNKIFFFRTSGTITIKLDTNHSWVKGILNCSNKGPGPLQRGDNHKYWVRSFKNLHNHWASIGHVYMKVFWYKVDSSFFKSWSPGVKRSHNRENHIHLLNVYIEEKNIFFRASRPISIKLGTNHPWVKGILNCSNRGPGPLQRGDNHKNVKIWRGHWKAFSLRTIHPE